MPGQIISSTTTLPPKAIDPSMAHVAALQILGKMAVAAKHMATGHQDHGRAMLPTNRTRRGGAAGWWAGGGCIVHLHAISPSMSDRHNFSKPGLLFKSVPLQSGPKVCQKEL